MKRLFTHLVHQGFSWQFPCYILFSWQSKWTSTWALKQFMKKPGPVKSLPVQLPRWPKWMKGAVAPTLKKPNQDPLVRKSFSQIWPKKKLILQMLGFAMKMLGKSLGDFPFHGDLMVIYIPWDPDPPIRKTWSQGDGHNCQSSIPWKSLATIFYRLVYEFHHFSSKGLSATQRNHHLLNGAWLMLTSGWSYLSFQKVDGRTINFNSTDHERNSK